MKPIDQKQQALEKLGLSAHATMDDIEHRYRILMRRARARQLRGEWGPEEEKEWEECHAAYLALRKERDHEWLSHYLQDRYGRFGRFATIAERLDNFWYHYRQAVIALLVSVILISSLIFGYTKMQRDLEVLAELPPADLSIMVVGDFGFSLYDQDEERAAEKLLKRLPEWRRIETKLYDVPLNPDNRTDYAKIRLAQMALMSERPDLYVLDQEQYYNLLQMGYLRKLDRFDDYAIYMGQGPLSQALSLSGGPVIVAVSVFCEKPDNAELFIKRFMQQN